MRVVVLLVLFGWGSLSSNAWSLDAEQWFVEGNRFSSAGKFEEAVRAYQKSIDQNPMAPVAHYNLGIAYKNLRQLDKAAVVLEKAVGLAPSNLDIRLTLGNIYNMQRKPEADVSWYNRFYGIIIGLIFSGEMFDAISTLLTPKETFILAEEEYERLRTQ